MAGWLARTHLVVSLFFPSNSFILRFLSLCIRLALPFRLFFLLLLLPCLPSLSLSFYIKVYIHVSMYHLFGKSLAIEWTLSLQRSRHEPSSLSLSRKFIFPASINRRTEPIRTVSHYLTRVPLSARSGPGLWLWAGRGCLHITCAPLPPNPWRINVLSSEWTAGGNTLTKLPFISLDTFVLRVA